MPRPSSPPGAKASTGRPSLAPGTGSAATAVKRSLADADNARGIRCYERCGFRHEGLLRAHRLRYGKPLDMVTMGILREEFDPA